MPLPAAALHVYCITIFEIGSRTLSQFQLAWQEELKVHAVKVEKYPIETYNKALKAERITQEQYDQLVAMIPVPDPVPEEPTGNEQGGDRAEESPTPAP